MPFWATMHFKVNAKIQLIMTFDTLQTEIDHICYVAISFTLPLQYVSMILNLII